MNKIQKFVISSITLLMLLMPNLAVAQTPATGNTCSDLKNQFTNAGGSEVIANVPTFCTPESVYSKFISIALYAVGIIAVIMIVYGGYLYMTARSNEAQKKQGKSVLTWAIIGLIVVIVAAVLVNVVVNSLLT